MEFQPQRWLKDGVFQPMNPFEYPIFQVGLRVCVGKEMDLKEMKSVVVLLLRKFHIELVSSLSCGINPHFSSRLTTTFSSGLHVMVHEREIITTTESQKRSNLIEGLYILD
ncbi:hypothetical protein JHK87_027031 [Glycine soja]|nr:hypothetical protein JHK87_027031 [Glycine soja]